MNFSIRLLVILVLSMLFLLQGCSGGGGSSDSAPASVDPVIVSKSGSFSIQFSDEEIEIFEYELSIKRGGEELTDTLLKYISHEKQSDGSILIALKEVDSKGLTSLKVGDIISLEAKGYTPQQFTIDAAMIDKASSSITLKAVQSRQTFSLADMTSGSDSVAPRASRGATTFVDGDNVTFQTNNKAISLTLPKVTYDRLARKIARLPRSGSNTQVHIDMTSIDPRTEHGATIGDFSYNPNAEPEAERTTNANEDSETGLESVVMAELKMTTDSGDEIHCFDEGLYDPTTNTCSGTAKATLKMQIPQSQFDDYAQKYNEGDRVVPLYSYNKENATWVRQLDSDGVGLDAELVLTDNDNNQKANTGDVLELIGKVSHFSYWNGDYPLSRTCLNVKLNLANAPEVSSSVRVKGVDYTGRQFTRGINSESTEVQGIPAKEKAIVSVELIMNDGSIGDSFTYTTGKRVDGTCEDAGTLTAPEMNKHELDVIVKDLDGAFLEDAYVSFKGKSGYTDANGSVSFVTAYAKDGNFSSKVSVSYHTGSFTVTGQEEVTQNDTSITFELDVAESIFTGKVVEVVNNVTTVANNAYVSIVNYGTNYYYKAVKTDENGSFEVKLPSSAVQADPVANIYIRKYNSDYAYYPSYNKEITLSKKDLGTFELSFSTHVVSGQVSDTEGESIPSASVYVRGSVYKSARSDENGNYEITILGDAEKEATLQARIYSGRYLSSDKYPFTTKVNGSTNQNLIIDLRKAVIKGRVLTSNGIALENMRVYWSKDYYQYVLTDEDGYFNLETYNGGDGYIRVYNTASYKYLDFDENINIRDVSLTGVETGKEYDLSNLLTVAQNFRPIISSALVNPSTPIANTEFTVTIDAYDPDGDALTYELEELYSRAGVSVEVTNNIASITANSAGSYYFNVIVKDEHLNETRKRLSIYVKNHVKPVIDSINYAYPNAKNYFDKSTDLNISVSAHSDEGNTLTYSYELVNLNSDGEDISLSSTDSSVTLATNIANGRYRLIVNVKDAYGSTSSRRYIIIDSTVAPVISSFKMNDINQTSIAIKQNGNVPLSVSLEDPTNVSNPTWYWRVNSQTTNTQAISPIVFTQEGSYYGYVTVRDTKGRSDSRSFRINVQADAKPIINSLKVTPQSITKIGTTYKDENLNSVSDITLNVDASDSDSSTLNYSFGNLDTTVATVNSNSATYSLAGLAVGRYAIKVIVSDATTSVESFVNIEILKDSPPVITEFRIPLKSKIAKTIELVSDATEPNGQALTYSWSSTSGTIGDSNLKATTLTIPNVAKDINVTLTVSDGVNNVTRTRTVNVLNNIAPLIEYFNLRTLTVSLDKQDIELKSIFADVDGSIKTARYILEDSNAKEIDSKTITLSNVLTPWTLDIVNAGTYKVYLEVIDNNDAKKVSTKAELIVEKANSKPTIANLIIANASLLLNEVTTLSVAVSDVDGDTVSVSWSATGGNIAVDTNTQDKATFSSASTGEFTITVIATDSNGAKSLKTISVIVQDSTLSLNTTKSQFTSGEDVVITAKMSTSHNVPTSTIWSLNSKPSNSSLEVTATGISLTITPDVVGTYVIEANTVINGVSFTATKSFVVQEIVISPDLEGVIKSDNGDILSGALVRLYNQNDSSLYDETVETDSNGLYSFNNVPSGIYYLVVYAGNGYVSFTQVVEITN